MTAVSQRILAHRDSTLSTGLETKLAQATGRVSLCNWATSNTSEP